MAFTQTDLDNVETAIVNLGKGRSVVYVTQGDKTVRYNKAELPDLLALRSLIAAELNSGSQAASFTNKVRFDDPT